MQAQHKMSKYKYTRFYLYTANTVINQHIFKTILMPQIYTLKSNLYARYKHKYNTGNPRARKVTLPNQAIAKPVTLEP